VSRIFSINGFAVRLRFDARGYFHALLTATFWALYRAASCLSFFLSFFRYLFASMFSIAGVNFTKYFRPNFL